MSAEWTPPAEVVNAVGLNALPPRAVVLDRDGDAWQKTADGHWNCTVRALNSDGQSAHSLAVILGPLTPLAAYPAIVAEKDADIERLRGWKSEAMQVLNGWERVHDALGKPARLGEFKHAACEVEAERLRRVIAAALELTDEIETSGKRLGYAVAHELRAVLADQAEES